MNSVEQLEDRIRQLRFVTPNALDQHILEDASAALMNSLSLEPQGSSIWRNIMRSTWTKLAAVILIAATFGTITFQRQLATVAYALEQTLQANLGLRSIHIRILEPDQRVLKEAWAEFNDDGTLLRLRMNSLVTEDGEKEVVWQEGKAEVWFKDKGHVLVAKDNEAAEKFSKELAAFDPKLTMQNLYKSEANGKAVIETQEPVSEGDPIKLVVTYKDSPGKRDVYLINPQTKLVEQLENYDLVEGNYKLLHRLEYLDYNQGIPPEKFVLDVPPETMRVDWTTQAVGLPQEDLTDDQIAMKVARVFFEALIAKDYSQAGKMFSGMPASKMEEAFGKMEFLRIVSVGDPTPHPDVSTQFLRVPCKIEIRERGETRFEEFVPLIRATYGQPDRWAIGGGI